MDDTHLSQSDGPDARMVRVPARDSLTGLASTALLRSRMREAEDELRDDPAADGYGLVLVSIRDLPAFNERHGTDVGDALVAAVALRLGLLATPRPGAGTRVG